jgi:hypothetical protein
MRSSGWPPLDDPNATIRIARSRATRDDNAGDVDRLCVGSTATLRGIAWSLLSARCAQGGRSFRSRLRYRESSLDERFPLIASAWIGPYAMAKQKCRP